MAWESSPDALLACVLSKVSSTLGLGVVQVVLSCSASGVIPAEVEDSTPGEAADAPPGEMEDVATDDDGTLVSCGGSVPISNDGVPGPDEEYLSLVVAFRPLVRGLQLPSMALQLLLSMTCHLPEGCLRTAAVCLGCALGGGSSLQQQYPPQACCPEFCAPWRFRLGGSGFLGRVVTAS